jgi:hypothetical protein
MIEFLREPQVLAIIARFDVVSSQIPFGIAKIAAIPPALPKCLPSARRLKQQNKRNRSEQRKRLHR